MLLASVSAFAGDGQTLYRQVATMSGESIPYAVHLPQEFDADVSYIIVDAQRFHSITGMVGNPRDAHDKLVAGGVDSVFEVVPNGEHVMTELVGSGFMQKLEKLR